VPLKVHFGRAEIWFVLARAAARTDRRLASPAFVAAGVLGWGLVLRRVLESVLG
jgi:hypothetical protein